MLLRIKLIILFIITFCIYVNCILKLIEEIDNPIEEIQENYFKNFISLYDDFSLIIHTDNVSLNVANYFLKSTKCSRKSYTFFNYDLNEPHNLKRPHHYKFVNFVILKNNSRFLIFANNFNVNLNDVIVFCLRVSDFNNRENNKMFTLMNSLKYAGNVLFLLFLKNTIRVYKKCYYCGFNSFQLKHLQTSTNEIVSIDKTDLLPNNFTDFDGHYFHVAYLDYFPYMFCERTEITVVHNVTLRICVEAFGAEATLLRELSKYLNFNYYLITDNYLNNRSASDVLDKVQSKEVDFAIGGISKTALNVEIVTFTKSIRFENYVFVFNYSLSLINKLFYLMYPFDIVLWVFVALTMITITVCLYTFVLVTKKSNLSFIRSFFVSNTNAIKSGNFLNDFQICLRCFLEQTTHMSTNIFQFRTRFSQYLILTILGFASIEIDIAYKSKLSSIIIRAPYYEPQNLADLLKENYEIVIQSLRNETVLDPLLANNRRVVKTIQLN